VSCRIRLTVLALALGLAACSADAPPPAPAEAAPPPAVDPSERVVAGSVPVVPGGLPTIVILEPKTPREVPPQVAKPVMDQILMTFTPSVLLVRTGQPAEFRNSDDVLHNVRVRNDATREGAFNVALPTGGSYSFTFDRDGFYDVGCDIHPGMAALVVSMSTPHTTLADGEGKFALHDVPPGAYKLIAYAGTQRLEREVEVGAGRTEVSVAGD
jgi:plastocyanin